MARKQHNPDAHTAAHNTDDSPAAPLPIVHGESLASTEFNPYISDVAEAPIVQRARLGDARGGDAPEGPTPQRYRVATTMSVMVNGVRTLMRFGKIVDDLNYNVSALKQQGLPLEPI